MDDRKQKRVLVVDDDQQLLEAMRLVLERHGYEVLVAHDGHEGLICAERESLDLIILDVMMPRRSGFGVLDRICLRGDTGPRIVVISATDEQRHEETARTKGAHRFLHKPFAMGEFLQTVDSLLQPVAAAAEAAPIVPGALADR
ncbi:MAG TPA: response regulator [Planctomycetaceae bacterium]|jgi:DNA-binding response OmpR family regulator|nr:response regulator [Planctomycetaceae bacterium]